MTDDIADRVGLLVLPGSPRDRMYDEALSLDRKDKVTSVNATTETALRMWATIHATVGNMQATHVLELLAELERLRQRLLTAAGDDLCRLTQEEIKAYTSGGVQIPPKEEFLPSCERFWEQTASKSGVLKGCLTMAQLVAENERLRQQVAGHTERIAQQSEILSRVAEKASV